MGSTAKKLRTPALAAGAGLAGLAGGIALTGPTTKSSGVPLPGAAPPRTSRLEEHRCARRAGRSRRRAVRVAGEALGGNEARRSPIESSSRPDEAVPTQNQLLLHQNRPSTTGRRAAVWCHPAGRPFRPKRNPGAKQNRTNVWGWPNRVHGRQRHSEARPPLGANGLARLLIKGREHDPVGPRTN